MMSSDEKKPSKGGIDPATPVKLSELVDYADGAVVSRTIEKGKAGTLTVFAFDEGEGLSEHTAPFNAYVTILDGVAELTIDGRVVTARAGETVLMPAKIPHALQANQRFKMLLSMIKERDSQV